MKNALHRAWPIEPPHELERDGDKLSLLTLCLPFPPSINTYWRHLANGRTLISEHGRHYRQHIHGVALMHKLAGAFPCQRLGVTLELVMPDCRRRDVDNYTKGLFDAFTSARIWGDDEQVDEMHVYKRGVSPPGFVIMRIACL
jgi:crossover junction endodeoxyribonuclease RusA